MINRRRVRAQQSAAGARCPKRPVARVAVLAVHGYRPGCDRGPGGALAGAGSKAGEIRVRANAALAICCKPRRKYGAKGSAVISTWCDSAWNSTADAGRVEHGSRTERSCRVPRGTSAGTLATRNAVSFWRSIGRAGRGRFP